MITRSQLPNHNSIASRVVSLGRNARKPGKNRGIRYMKPRRLCNYPFSRSSLVKKPKARTLVDERLSKSPALVNESISRKKSLPMKESKPVQKADNVDAPVHALSCATPRACADANPVILMMILSTLA